MDKNRNLMETATEDGWLAPIVLGLLATTIVAFMVVRGYFASPYHFKPSRLGIMDVVNESAPPFYFVRWAIHDLVNEPGHQPRHYPVSTVDWKAERGKWIVLVLAELPDDELDQLNSKDALSLGTWLAALRHALNKEHPGTEVWFVRTDMPRGFSGRLLGGRPEFQAGCFVYKAGCFDRFLVGFVEPGDDGLHFKPQMDWILKVHKSPRVAAQQRKEVALPLMILVRPDGRMVAVNRDQESSFAAPGTYEFLDFFAWAIKQFEGGDSDEG